MSVMPSQNSVRPMEVNGGEEVVTVGGRIQKVRVTRKKLRQEERRGKW